MCFVSLGWNCVFCESGVELCVVSLGWNYVL